MAIEADNNSLESKELVLKYDNDLNRHIDGGIPQLLTGDWSETKHDLWKSYLRMQNLTCLNGPHGPPTPDWAGSKADNFTEEVKMYIFLFRNEKRKQSKH